MKPGPKPQGKVKLSWSPRFAYAIGLLTADGCLSKDGRHVNLTSKDEDQILTFKKCLGIDSKVRIKYSGAGNQAYYLQFSDVLFYRFLLSIGLTPAKSKTLSKLVTPRKYFIDFLRGYFDGDGTSFSYYDPKFEKSFRFYLSFASASPSYVNWLREQLKLTLGVKGYINHYPHNSYLQLKYAKKEAIVISRAMYYRAGVPCLKRKHDKIKESLRVIKLRRSGEIGRHATFRS